ncbi:MAG TPA: glycosyltransferase family 2 protein [Candidatus Bathyarchaeia archaeon]|nr:glycosyltransferase family 2 protein [Candidatus Bathyarchaeia archaeon]
MTLELVEILSILLAIPVLASSYYATILFTSSLFYPRKLEPTSPNGAGSPRVSVVVATYNEKFVVGKTLDALKSLRYPRGKIKLIIADDSTDETRETIDGKCVELRNLGFETVVSRRESRAGFKSGALNQAVPLLDGEYVLLLDADSVVTSDVLATGLAEFASRRDLAFVSYRVGHYNREQNLVTKLFALSLDLGDTQTKMGAYRINTPFSFQGGFVLLSRAILEELGYWSVGTITEDADLSCKIYAMGRRGVYLSNVRIFSEDPQTLEVWKRQSARVAQGWAKCLKQNWKRIVWTSKLSVPKRVALLMMFLNPFSSLCWIILTFLSALAIALGISVGSNSLFSSLWYNILITAPALSFFGAAAYSLFLQRIATLRNLALLPLLSYTGFGMFAAIAIGFVKGIRGETGIFFRTPKTGGTHQKTADYFQRLGWDKRSVAETSLALTAIILAIPVILQGVWFLALSLIGFGLLTLKSINFSRLRQTKQTC